MGSHNVEDNVHNDSRSKETLDPGDSDPRRHNDLLIYVFIYLFVIYLFNSGLVYYRLFFYLVYCTITLIVMYLVD